MSKQFDREKWAPITTDMSRMNRKLEPDTYYQAEVAHWNGHDWLCIWCSPAPFPTRGRARTAAIKKIHELVLSGYQRPAAA